MIEVIYDNAEEETENGEIQGIRLPKNIRQVGTPQGGRRIYVEDYVMTYLNQLAKPGNTYARGAILLGEYKQADNQGVLFISGALEAQNVEFDLEEIEFTNEIWSNIYNDVKRYFPDLEVVGWFLSRMGFSTQMNEKISKIHIDNFPGRDKALFMIDSLEEEDAWYLFENNGLKKQSGYYIYYTRNDAMQGYMMIQRNHMVESETDIAERDQELLKRYRSRLEQKTEPVKEQKPISFLYVASSLLTVAFLALGITVINSYDRLKNLETAFHRIDIMTDGNTEEPVTNVVSVNANVEPSTEKDASTNTSDTTAEVQNSEAATATEQNTEDTAAGTQSPSETSSEAASDTEEPEPDISPAFADDVPKYYTVQAGDTLSSISFAMYHSILYVDNIMEANEMKNGDEIYVGQQILIPSIP
ncbi:MAG: LysM peptidoglycan-binding domain-containing protein [Bacteroides sp.]|nr:LysM peptidoglycan-binding domain-containing protein [Bacteroides sp.]MCM1550945.1 LysM peptidoglycan-binding domain-containing protein [Clostridium sp.]